MQTLRKKLSKYMQFISLILAIIILFFIAATQILTEQENARSQAYSMFTQIEQILEENQEDLQKIQKEYRETCLLNAETIAYIIENRPEILEDDSELRSLARMMEVDEIHIFDETGRIFTGTHPEYYDMTFESGKQIGFFKPLLDNKSLKLCQEITPNTAEEKMMQYSALWSKSERFIVQVGMEPINIMQATEKNELSYIFSLLKVNVGVSIYAINSSTGEIVGSTSSGDLGKYLEEIGLNFEKIANDPDGFHATVNGVNSFCVFQNHGDNLLGHIISTDTLYARIPSYVTGLTLCVMLLVTALVIAVSRYVNQYVVDGISSINATLRSIGKGNLQERVTVQNSAEFAELSDHINEMLESIMDNNKKMSYVLSKTNLFMGIFEFNRHMSKVRYTEYLPRILGINSDKLEELSYDYLDFQDYIDSIKKRPFPGEEGVYILGRQPERYIRLEEIRDRDQIFGVLIDMTDELAKRRKVESERDLDPLTGLYNRRGIDRRIETMFQNPTELEYGALIMMDADGLKGINDKYGHEKGDIYLKKIAKLITFAGFQNYIAARQGGDEYVLFLYSYPSEESLMTSIERLRSLQASCRESLGDGIEVDLRFSFGYTLIQGRSDFQNMLKEADDKMYEDKRHRKAAMQNN